MKPKTTRKFYVEWRGKSSHWYRSMGYAETLAKAVKLGKRFAWKDPMRIVEAVTTETIHKV